MLGLALPGSVDAAPGPGPATLASLPARRPSIVASRRSIPHLDAQQPAQVPVGDPDALYRDRESLESARQAATIWEARLAANPRDFESAWKLARIDYWLGTNGLPKDQRKAALESGVEAGRVASALEPKRPEGHFWMAANMGALAESFGLRQGIRYRGAIKAALETVLALDPDFQDGSADRALGRWYLQVPGLFGGDDHKSEEHLRRALAYNEQSIITRLFLAQTLWALGRKEDARSQLRAALEAPVDPEWAPEDRRFKGEAEELLKRYSR
jgi:tetratricopeptide (TPR) repeat protein